MYSITVVGTGYVGLVSGACLADFGNNVICVDSDASKVERLNALELPFFEPGLPEMVQRNVNEGRLHFTTDLPAAVKQSKVVFITVGTPPKKDGSADTSAIYAVAKTVAQNLNGYTLVVQNYPTSSNVPEAYFRRGRAYEDLGQTDAARASWELVVKTYPDTTGATLAKQGLDRLIRKATPTPTP